MEIYYREENIEDSLVEVAIDMHEDVTAMFNDAQERLTAAFACGDLPAVELEIKRVRLAAWLAVMSLR